MKTTRNWLIAYITLYIASLYLFPLTSRILTLSLILAMLIEVPTGFFKNERARRLAALLTGVGLVVIVVYLLSSSIPMIISNISSFGNEIDRILEGERFNRLMARLPESVAVSVKDFLGSLNNVMIGFALDTARKVAASASSWLTGAVLLIIGSVYLLRNKKNFSEKIVPVVFPGCDRESLRDFLGGFNRDLQNYVFQRTIIALSVGTTIGAGAFLLGIPHPLFFAILGAITNYIPYVGVVMTGIPFLLVGNAAHGFWGVFGVIAILLVAGVIDGWVMTPMLMSKRLRMNWFIILVAVIAIGELLGIFGMIIGIPALLFIKRFWSDFVMGRSDGILE